MNGPRTVPSEELLERALAARSAGVTAGDLLGRIEAAAGATPQTPSRLPMTIAMRRAPARWAHEGGRDKPAPGRPALFGMVALLVTLLLGTGVLVGSRVLESIPPAAGGGLAGTTWLVVTMYGNPVEPPIGATLGFTASDAAGFGGCDRYSGGYTTDGTSSLTFGPIRSTTRSCHFTDGFEERYLTALAAVTSYTGDADALSLADSTGTVLLTFAAIGPALEGAWDVTMVDGRTGGGLEVVPEGIGATMVFDPDGTVEGFDGCGFFFGGYRVDGSAFGTASELGDGFKTCDDSTDTFVERYLAALHLSNTWAITSGTLELREAAEESVVTLVVAVSAVGH